MGKEPTWGKKAPDADVEGWPKDEAGQTVAPAFLVHTAGLDFEDSMTVSMLQAFGIPTIKRYPGDGEFGNIILGVSGGGVDIYVPETMLSEARDILSAEVQEDEL